jgi:cell division protein FtsQ
MDDRGRLAQPLKGITRWRFPARGSARPISILGQPAGGAALHPIEAIARSALRLAARLPRGAGLAATVAVILASLVYGAVKGDHLPVLIEAFKAARDGIANTAGLRITTITLAGNHHVSREEVFAIAGITGSSSLPFLDVDETRERLKSSPWIADATVLKLYPRELQITIRERAAFAIWQKDGRVSVIADDGTVLEPYVAPRLVRLPLVVGRGAAEKAREFLAVLERFPPIADSVWASVLVSNRRWNLRLKNGVEVRLPETEPAAALNRLLALDREKNLIARDITVIDLRLSDRITVRLSEAAAQARIDALKDKSKKKAGNA